MWKKATIPDAVRRGQDQAPDLETQLEEILVEVWRQETFERMHPFTCGVIRESARRTAQRCA